MEVQRPRPSGPSAEMPGRDEAFDGLYAHHVRRLVTVAAVTTGDVEGAEEIVQEAFLQLYRQWDQVREPVPWLRRTVANLSTSWLRRTITGRRVSALSADRDEAFRVGGDVELRSLLDTLSPRERAAVVLRYFEDLPAEEIAGILGLRPGSVRSLLSRSLSKIRKEWDHADHA